MRVDTLLTGGIVVTMDADCRVIEDGAIAIRDGKIEAVGTTSELAEKWQADRILDCRGHIVIPGLIDVHAHAGHGLVKSIGMHGGVLSEENRLSRAGR